MSISLYHPTQAIEGTIHLTSSKSESNRALIIQALCEHHFEINNLADANDTHLLQQLLNNNDPIFDTEDAGSTMRFLTAYLSTQKGEYIITGSDRMKQRPIKILVDALRTLGAKIEYLEKEGFPPLKILPSTIKGGAIEIDGSVSSQYISALLLIGPQLKNGLTLHLKEKIISRPYY